MKKEIIIIVLVVIIIVLAGFLFLNLKSQKQSQENKTEINQPTQKNYIGLRGAEGMIEGKISPANGSKVTGIIEVLLTKVPTKTDVAKFALIPSGKELSNQDLSIDSDGSNGWSILFDTNTKVNGLYDVIALTEYTGNPDNAGPLDFVKVQIIIEN